MVRYLIIIERGDAGYGSTMPDVPGVPAVPTGDSPQEVARLLAEALAEHQAGPREDGEPGSLRMGETEVSSTGGCGRGGAVLSRAPSPFRGP